MKTLTIIAGCVTLWCALYAASLWYWQRCAVYGRVCSITHCSPICQDGLRELRGAPPIQPQPQETQCWEGECWDKTTMQPTPSFCGIIECKK